MVDPLFDVRPTEDLRRVREIVRSTSNTEIRDRLGASERLCLDMIELQEAACRAAIALRVDERALLTVASEDLASDRPRNMPPSLLLVVFGL